MASEPDPAEPPGPQPGSPAEWETIILLFGQPDISDLYEPD